MKSYLWCLFGVVVFIGCDSLWSGFNKPNPAACLDKAPDFCPSGTFCHTSLNRCISFADLDGGVPDGGTVVVTPGCSTAGFCWESPLPVGSTLRATWAGSDNDRWAVGDFGNVIRWNGVSWSLVPSGVRDNLRAIWGRTSNDLWVGGNNGVVLR